jgi:hypothetical protein
MAPRQRRHPRLDWNGHCAKRNAPAVWLRVMRA